MMTGVNLKFEINLEVNGPESANFRNAITRIQRIIGDCLDLTDENLIVTYDHIFADWKVME